MVEKFRDLGFTRAEAEVAAKLAVGMNTKEIAESFKRAENTVKFHIKNIYRRAEARDRASFMIFCAQRFPEAYQFD